MKADNDLLVLMMSLPGLDVGDAAQVCSRRDKAFQHLQASPPGRESGWSSRSAVLRHYASNPQELRPCSRLGLFQVCDALNNNGRMSEGCRIQRWLCDSPIPKQNATPAISPIHSFAPYLALPLQRLSFNPATRTWDVVEECATTNKRCARVSRRGWRRGSGSAGSRTTL
jgi:hypothetical protein